MSDWRDDHERDPLGFDDEERLPPRSEAEGVRVLGPDDDATRPAPRPVPRRGRRAADDSEEFWGEPFADAAREGDPGEAPGDATWSASSQGLTDPESKPRTRRGRRAARRGAAATPPPESRARPESPPEASGPVQLPHWTEPPTGEVPPVISGPQPATPTDDDLDGWRAASGQSPRYRTEDSDWAERDFSSPEFLKDDSLALGALRDRDLPDDEVDDVDDDDEAFAAEVAARRRRGDGRRRPVRRTRPSGTLEEGQEPTAPAEEHGPPPDLVTRLLTAAAIAVVALIMLKLGRGATTILVAVIVGAAAFELYEAFRRAGYHPATVIGLLGCVSIVGIAYTDGLDAFPLVTILVVAFTMLWYMLEVVKARPIVNIAITLLGFGYVGIFGAFAGLLLSAPDGTGFIIGLALCAIGYDVFGYFIGSQFGRSRMSPRLSPHKTWEGLIGGMVAAIVLGGIVGTLLAPWNDSVWHGLALGLVVAIVAPIGDLCESMIKRDLGIKDLGTLLPGHGGVLDRFDAMLFCLPAVYYLAIQLKIV